MGGGSEMLKVGLKEIKRRERRGIKKKKKLFLAFRFVPF